MREYLEKVKEKQEFWELKELELLQLKTLETKTTVPLNPVSVQSSGDKDKLGTAVTKRIVFEEKVVEKAKNDFLNYRDECIKFLEQVKKVNFNHYRLLHLKYIEYFSLKKVAKKTGYAYQTTKEMHLEALENAQKIFDFSKLPTETY